MLEEREQNYKKTISDLYGEIERLQKWTAEAQEAQQEAETREMALRQAMEAAPPWNTPPHQLYPRYQMWHIHVMQPALAQPAGQPDPDCGDCIYDWHSRCAALCEGCTVWARLSEAERAGKGE